jgi:hypothetical protein
LSVITVTSIRNYPVCSGNILRLPGSLRLMLPRSKSPQLSKWPPPPLPVWSPFFHSNDHTDQRDDFALPCGFEPCYQISASLRPDHIIAAVVTAFYGCSLISISGCSVTKTGVESYNAMEAHWGGGGKKLLLVLHLGTRWGWMVSVTPRPRFTPGERTSGTHCTGGWMGSRAGLDAEARRKILCPCRGSNPDRPARSQTLYCLSYRGSYYDLVWIILGTFYVMALMSLLISLT